MGQLDLVILEPSSQLSLYKKDEPVAGLSILPEDDGDIDAMDLEIALTACSAGQSNNYRYKPIDYVVTR